MIFMPSHMYLLNDAGMLLCLFIIVENQFRPVHIIPFSNRPESGIAYIQKIPHTLPPPAVASEVRSVFRNTITFRDFLCIFMLFWAQAAHGTDSSEFQLPDICQSLPIWPVLPK